MKSAGYTTVKLQGTCAEGRALGPPTSPRHSTQPLISDVVGDVNESNVFVNDHPCAALIDTGSQVTTLSESFWKQNLSDCPLQPLSTLIEVEGAGGHKIPFMGFIEAEISFPQEVNGIHSALGTVILVVEDTAFNLRIPLLIGTNLIRRCKDSCVENYGSCFLQGIRTDTAWSLAYKFLSQRDRMIRKYHPSAKVHSEQGSRPVTLHGQASTVLWAKVETRSVGGSLTALVDQSENDLP